MTMLSSLLPASVVSYEERADIPGDAPFAGEEWLIDRAVESRRREFITGRRCARRALADLGFPLAPILRGPNREPLWPAGVVSSITRS